MSEDIARELGAITATLEHIKDTQEHYGKTLEKVDGRLRKVETRSAINGAVSGGIITVAIGLIRGSFPSS